jgi:hypothetical protein
MIDEGWAGGIQDNADLVEDAVSDLSDDVATELQMSPVVGSGAAISEQTTDSRIDRLIQLMEEYLPQMAENRVVLEGDAEGLFNVMQNQNKIYKRMNGESAFA